jgi:hypothetical protein
MQKVREKSEKENAMSAFCQGAMRTLSLILVPSKGVWWNLGKISAMSAR